MPDACREIVSRLWLHTLNGGAIPGAANAALLRDRYLRVSVKDKTHPDSRRELFRMMSSALDQPYDVYHTAYDRYIQSLGDPLATALFKTKGRMILGLGNENVLETGLTLHHTYGTPAIPGTALKGLTSHYCDQVWRIKDKRFKRDGEYHKAIFGTTADSGHIIFHDAWITPETLRGSLQPDVMTPHHGDYYSSKAAPTDFDDPNPVTFLSILGTFHIVVSCDIPGEEGKNWAELVFKLLSEALNEWGIGGKTAAGYGRLVPDGKHDQTGVPKTSDAPASRAPGARYPNGKTVTVTRAQDPNPKKDRPYFIADDGIGGFVEIRGPDFRDIEIGAKCDLVVYSFLDGDNRYSFATPGSWSPNKQPGSGKR